MNRSHTHALALFALALTCSIGCHTSPKQARMKWTVGLDKELQGEQAPNVTVKVAGITDDEREQWQAFAIPDLLQPVNPAFGLKEKDGLFQRIELSSSEPEKPLESNVAKRFSSGAWHVVVVANYPRNAPPGLDTRRRIIPLDSRAWPGVKEVKIRVTSTGVVVDPSPKPIIK